MSDQRRIIELFYGEIWNKHNHEIIAALVHEGFTFRGSLGQSRQGRAGFAEYVDLVHTALGEYRCDIHDIVSEGDKAFARMRFSGIHRGEFLGYPPTHKRVEWAGAAVFTFDGDKIADLWVLGDVHGLVEQLKRGVPSVKSNLPIAAVTLSGRHVRLEPLGEEHREGLRVAADDERIWQHTLTAARGAGFDTWFGEAQAQREAGRQLAFAVRRVADGMLVGSTSYLEPVLRHRQIEIGSTWYVPTAWGTVVNAECKLLLMTHAFEALGTNRVQFVTDLVNLRSQAAITKLGAVREGVLRSHKITHTGRVRDSVVFSVVAGEWPAVKAGLETRVAQARV